MFAFNKIMLVATALAGLQAGTYAQSISSQCQAALGSIITSSDASCLNAQGLVGLVVSSSSSSNSSIVPTVDSWLKGLCGRAVCSNDTLSAVVQNITSGCSSELSSSGFDVNAGELTSLVQSFYPTVRQVACLADSSNGNTLCLTETLNNIQPYTGTLTMTNIEAIVNNFFSSGAIPDVPSNVTCTDCTKAAYNVVSQNFGDITGDTKTGFTNSCGASFTDGSQPSSVTQLASVNGSSTTVTPNGAAPSFAAVPVLGLVTSSMVAISVAFALLV